MVEEYECLKQPLGTNSCVATCIKSMLQYAGYECCLEEIRNWCEEERQGCNFVEAMTRLGQQGFTVDEIHSEERFQEFLSNDIDGTPVITNIQVPPSGSLHAVVILGFVTDDYDVDIIEYCDPLSGTIQSMPWDNFWRMWDLGDQSAYMVSP